MRCRDDLHAQGPMRNLEQYQTLPTSYKHILATLSIKAYWTENFFEYFPPDMAKCELGWPVKMHEIVSKMQTPVKIKMVIVTTIN